MVGATGFQAGLQQLARSGFRLDTTTLTRALYSSDASLYRVVPAAVRRPETRAELEALLDAARDAQLPVTVRGAGTSIAGNAVGPGLVLDLSGLNRITELDPQSRSVQVEPGVVPTRLNQLTAKHRLRFGPDPSTVDRCTIGGMIGNNACGSRALGYGRTADNVLALTVVTGTGERLTLDQHTRPGDSPTLTALHRLVQQNLGVIRTEFGRFPRQISGYSLEHLLPEHGFNVARFLVGSEGTLAVVTDARVRLVPEPGHRTLVVLGYPDILSAATDVPDLLSTRPVALEGLDRRLVAAAGGNPPPLPEGGAWLFVELTDDDPESLGQRASELVGRAATRSALQVTDPGLAVRLWAMRSDGAGLAQVALGRPAHSGWEDAAVPVERLGDYLRDFEALLGRHGLDGIPYGHFGEGCVHVRIDFPLNDPSGIPGYRRFIIDAAELAHTHSGSFSGEHGDGRARSELLPRMYSPAALALFAAVKQIFDPQNLLNPQVLVNPRPLDADLRRPQVAASTLPRLDANFTAEVHRCSGVGKCLTSTEAMCPSYQASGRESDSTRGRARVLQEMVNGQLVSGGWQAPEVAAALDLCLSCKACASECPTGVDLAAYKSRVLAESYRGRLRPRSHYLLGRLPAWGRLVTRVPGLARMTNLVLGFKPTARLAKWVAGVDQRRGLPRFALHSRRRTHVSNHAGRPVVVWVDSFSDTMADSRLDPLLELLNRAGYAPRVLQQTACCGLPWLTTGQLDRAGELLRHAVEILHPVVAAGIPIVGLEPSCLAVWRSDAASLLTDPRVGEVAAGTHTLAELLTRTPDWRPPDLSGITVIAQPHCHHQAVLGWQTDATLLARTGAQVHTIDGCCGLAGNFGMEAGHYEMSVAVARNKLLPTLAAHGRDAILLADGFSCRVQARDLADQSALTLAELLLSGDEQIK